MSPTYTAGRADSARETTVGAGPAPPAARRSAVPTVGTSATHPGKAMSVEYTNAETTTATRPSAASADHARDRRLTRGRRTATSPPIASSQARVVVTK
ncbi:Uncharacterised protein [Mycobacteroides abscessus]|nr:Uncharacterised protein [Mycobacteroides abscessus]